MSSRIRKTRTTSLIFMALGATAIVAAVAIGFTGVPQATAGAASIESETSLLQGWNPTMTVEATKLAEAKFESVATSDAAVSASSGLTRLARKRVTHRIRARSSWKRARVSWYGPGFYGHTMAGGGKLLRKSLIVAHRSMRFGTKVQFTYQGRSVVAVVRDRGPYVSGRAFDLGPGTARALKFGGVGTVSYRIVR